MEKWADYLISAVKYNDPKTHIIAVKTYADLGDKVGAEQHFSRQQVVQGIENGTSFMTIFNVNNKWQKGQLKVTHIMYKANVNCKVLKEHLNFLTKQGLIEQRVVGKGRVVYANTARGTTVLTYFRELNKALPINEEDSKILPVFY